MIRSLVLFSHVVGVVAFFAGLCVEWLSLDAIRRSVARAEAVRWVRVSRTVLRVSGVAFAVILASGFYLGARIHVLGDGWLRASYAALLLMGIVGGPVTRPRMRALQRSAEDPRDEAIVTLRAAASANILRASLRARVTFGLAVVYLMIAKPDVSESLIVLSLALILAIVLAVWTRPALSTLAEEYR